MAGELVKTMERGAGASGSNPPPKKDGLLQQALTKIETLRNSAATTRGRMDEVGDMMIATIETTATNLAASAAEGYWGEDKMKIGPVDLRVVGGGTLGAWGFYKAMNGKGGSHELALGNGLLQSFVSSAGRRAGAALAEKANTGAANNPAPPPNPATPPNPNVQGADVEGIVRDIGRNLQLGATEGAEGDDAGAGRGRGRKHRKGKGRRRPDNYIPVRVR